MVYKLCLVKDFLMAQDGISIYCILHLLLHNSFLNIATYYIGLILDYFFSMIDKKINSLRPKYTFQNETRATIPYLFVLLLCCDDSKIILHVDSSSEFTQTTFKTSSTNV